MERVEIQSRDHWFKGVEFLQQNGALIDAAAQGRGCTVFFLGDTPGVLDRMSFTLPEDAARALRRNGFARCEDDAAVMKIMAPPRPPLRMGVHPNGPIYSSGRFWIEESGHCADTLHASSGRS